MPKNARRHWTSAQTEMLLTISDKGGNDRTIARLTGRTIAAVRCKRHAIYGRLGGNGDLTVGDLAGIFGVTPRAITLWTGAGRLPCRLTQHGHRRVSRDQLAAFMADENTWGWWKPEQLAPGYWRELGAELRRGVELLSLADAGRRLGYSRDALWKWVRKGTLRTIVGRGPSGQRRRFTRVDWLPAVAS